MTNESQAPVNGLTQKELLLRVEGLLEAHIQQSTQQHSTFMEQITSIREKQAVHEADNHQKVVAGLKEQEIREEGRRDVLKYIFGTSVVALVCGIGGLVFAVLKFAGIGGA